MKLKKFFIACTLATLIFLAPSFGIMAAAEEMPDGAVEDVEVPTVGVTVPEYAVIIKYTADSSTAKGISYDAHVDPATFAVGFKIVDDLSIGHVIYDDPDTEYIDGIRINDETVDTLSVVVEQGKTYEVVIRTVYEDNLLGDFAKIVDGNFNFKTLLENPVTLFMCSYYILSIFALIVSAFAALFSKSKKVKTADEIAAKVDASANVAVEKVRTEVTDTVLAEVTPILQTILDDIRNIVTAVTLSTSKSKEAPLALLDTLQKSAEATNITNLIDDIRKDVSEGISKEADVKSANLEALREIANTTATVVDVTTDSTTKSVF